MTSTAPPTSASAAPSARSSSDPRPHPDGPQGHPGGWRFLAPLVMITAMGPVSMQIILPALPAIGEHFTVGAGTTHLLVSLALIFFGSAMLVWGPLSDRYGRRLPMLMGTIVFTVGALICWVAPNIEILLFGRVLGAIGGSAGMVLTRAMVRDVYPTDKVAGAISQLTVGQIVPPMLAPILGGFLTETGGWHWNFLVLLASGIIALLIIWRLPETHNPDSAPSGGESKGLAGAILGSLVGSFSHLMRQPAFVTFAVFGMFAMAGYFAFISGAPEVAMEIIGMSPSTYGLAYVSLSLSFMAGNMVSARLSAGQGVDRMVLIGGMVSAFGAFGALAALLLVPGAASSAWTLFVGGGLLAFGNGLSLNNAQAGAMAVSPAHAGAAAGLTGFLQMAFGSLAVQGLGVIHNGTSWPLFIAMGIAAGGGILIYGVRRSPQG